MVTYIKVFNGVTFNLKVVTHLKSASETSYDVINMATINRMFIKAIVCIAKVVLNQHKLFFNTISCVFFYHMVVKSMFYVTLIINYFSITIICMQNTVYLT